MARVRSDKARLEESDRVRRGTAALAKEDPQERSEAVRALISEETVEFLRRRDDKIRRLKLEELNINPYGLRLASAAMSLRSAEDVVDHLVDATLHAGFETAYGWLMDLMIPPYFGATTPPERDDPNKQARYKEFDKQVVRDGRRWLISIKSGPYTINDTMAREMHTNVKGVVEYLGDGVVYAVTYGWEELLSNKPGIVKGEFTDDQVMILVGRDWWDWLADYDGAYLDVYRGIERGIDLFAERYGATVEERLRDKKAELVKEFRQLFQIEEGSDPWDALARKGFQRPDTV